MKKKIVYRCSECGNETIKWSGNCLQCGSWNSIHEVEVDIKKKSSNTVNKKLAASPIKLSEIDLDQSQRIETSIDEFNRVLGGGIVRDSVSILTAKPGAGKSTLLLEIANDVANKGYKVLYA